MNASELSEYWLSNEFLTWGVGFFIFSNLGYWVPALFFEWIITTNCVKSSLITYGKNKNSKEDRSTNLLNTQKRIPFLTQVWYGFLTTCGPTAILNVFLNYFLYSKLLPKQDMAIPDWSKVFIDLLLTYTIGDFFLYVGHRIQHQIPFLWKYHSLHHQLDTPSPISTLYIDPIDATLQGALPMLFAILIMRPHPYVAYIYLFIRLAENVVNHTGIDSLWMDIITLKFIPGRAKISHHDRHHKFCNYDSTVGNAKNYGEGYVIWYWIFGTVR